MRNHRDASMGSLAWRLDGRDGSILASWQPPVPGPVTLGGLPTQCAHLHHKSHCQTPCEATSSTNTGVSLCLLAGASRDLKHRHVPSRCERCSVRTSSRLPAGLLHSRIISLLPHTMTSPGLVAIFAPSILRAASGSQNAVPKPKRL